MHVALAEAAVSQGRQVDRFTAGTAFKDIHNTGILCDLKVRVFRAGLSYARFF